jgi:hypothetical protein
MGRVVLIVVVQLCRSSRFNVFVLKCIIEN